MRETQARTKKIIGAYAKRFGLTREEALERLNAPYDEDSRAYGHRMSLADALREDAQAQAERLAALTEAETDKQREFTARESYQRTRTALYERLGRAEKFAVPDVNGMLGSMGTCWAGKSYSERIWSNTDRLAKTLNEEITAAFISGKSNAKIEQIIMERFGAGFREAERLVRTETSYVCNKAALKGYADAEITEYEYLTAKDSRTCKVCAGMDGERFPISEAQAGVNMPPMHPFCRCMVVAVVDSELSRDNAVETVYNNSGASSSTGDYVQMMRADEPHEAHIDIDELTPCLRKTSTGQLVETTVERISPTHDATKDWEFDWTAPERNGFQVYALKAKGDSRIQGMVATLADEANKAVHIDIVEAAPHNSVHNPTNKAHTRAYNGVGGHLFAEAARQSQEKGYGGFVFFKAKSSLVDYYQNAFGAQLINPRERIMVIDEVAASRLIKNYYGGD